MSKVVFVALDTLADDGNDWSCLYIGHGSDPSDLKLSRKWELARLPLIVARSESIKTYKFDPLELGKAPIEWTRISPGYYQSLNHEWQIWRTDEQDVGRNKGKWIIYSCKDSHWSDSEFDTLKEAKEIAYEWWHERNT